MKKTLLLSVVASTMIMAGGDIAPVEPVVEAPAVVSGWDFSGQAVVYYQTASDSRGGVVNLAGYTVDDMFSQANSAANAGIQLSAVNKDLIGGIGAGIELTGLGTLGLDEDVVSGIMQSADGELNGGAITQAYLTYATGNTSFKIGRQNLPLALSPFAFSEDWNVFKNSFDAALIVNTDLPNTTLVAAYVTDSNGHSDLGDFKNIADADGVFMLTAQNTSIENTTLTGTWYHASDVLGMDDADVLWADAKFALGEFNLALQGGTIMPDITGTEDTTAYGAMVSGKLAMLDVALAYTSVDDGTVAVRNLGTGANAKTPLYTQMVSNQNFISSNSDTVVVKASMAALGGTISAAYDYSDIGAMNAFGAAVGTLPASTVAGDFQEFDLVYTTKVTDNIDVLAAYVYQDMSADVAIQDFDNNIIRLWAKYNF